MARNTNAALKSALLQLGHAPIIHRVYLYKMWKHPIVKYSSNLLYAVGDIQSYMSTDSGDPDTIILTSELISTEFSAYSSDSSNNNTFSQITENGSGSFDANNEYSYMGIKTDVTDYLISIGEIETGLERDALGTFFSDNVQLRFNNSSNYFYDAENESGLFWRKVLTGKLTSLDTSTSTDSTYSAQGITGKHITVNDTSQSMTANEYRGDFLEFISGNAVGRKFPIISNGTNSFEICTPDDIHKVLQAGDSYKINHEWEYLFKIVLNVKSVAAQEVTYISGKIMPKSIERNDKERTVDIVGFNFEKNYEEEFGWQVSEKNGYFQRIGGIKLQDYLKSNTRLASRGIKKVKYIASENLLSGIEIKAVGQDTTPGIKFLDFKPPDYFRYNLGRWYKISDAGDLDGNDDFPITGYEEDGNNPAADVINHVVLVADINAGVYNKKPVQFDIQQLLLAKIDGDDLTQYCTCYLDCDDNAASTAVTNRITGSTDGTASANTSTLTDFTYKKFNRALNLNSAYMYVPTSGTFGSTASVTDDFSIHFTWFPNFASSAAGNKNIMGTAVTGTADTFRMYYDATNDEICVEIRNTADDTNYTTCFDIPAHGWVANDKLDIIFSWKTMGASTNWGYMTMNGQKLTVDTGNSSNYQNAVTWDITNQTNLYIGNDNAANGDANIGRFDEFMVYSDDFEHNETTPDWDNPKLGGGQVSVPAVYLNGDLLTRDTDYRISFNGGGHWTFQYLSELTLTTNIFSFAYEYRSEEVDKDFMFLHFDTTDDQSGESYQQIANLPDKEVRNIIVVGDDINRSILANYTPQMVYDEGRQTPVYFLPSAVLVEKAGDSNAFFDVTRRFSSFTPSKVRFEAPTKRTNTINGNDADNNNILYIGSPEPFYGIEFHIKTAISIATGSNTLNLSLSLGGDITDSSNWKAVAAADITDNTTQFTDGSDEWKTILWPEAIGWQPSSWLSDDDQITQEPDFKQALDVSFDPMRKTDHVYKYYWLKIELTTNATYDARAPYIDSIRLLPKLVGKEGDSIRVLPDKDNVVWEDREDDVIIRQDDDTVGSGSGTYLKDDVAAVWYGTNSVNNLIQEVVDKGGFRASAVRNFQDDSKIDLGSNAKDIFYYGKIPNEIESAKISDIQVFTTNHSTNQKVVIIIFAGHNIWRIIEDGQATLIHTVTFENNAHDKSEFDLNAWDDRRMAVFAKTRTVAVNDGDDYIDFMYVRDHKDIGFGLDNHVFQAGIMKTLKLTTDATDVAVFDSVTDKDTTNSMEAVWTGKYCIRTGYASSVLAIGKARIQNFKYGMINQIVGESLFIPYKQTIGLDWDKNDDRHPQSIDLFPALTRTGIVKPERLWRFKRFYDTTLQGANGPIKEVDPGYYVLYEFLESGDTSAVTSLPRDNAAYMGLRFELGQKGREMYEPFADWRPARIGYYQCEDNAASTTVVATTGSDGAVTTTNTNAITNINGKVGRCFYIDALADRLQLPSANINPAKGSISFWVKPDFANAYVASASTGKFIIDMYSGALNSDITFTKASGSSGSYAFQIIDTSGAVNRHNVTLLNSTVQPYFGQANGQNDWVKFTLKWDDTNVVEETYYLAIYINDVYITPDSSNKAEKAWTAQRFTAHTVHVGGAGPGVAGTTFEGYYDEIEFYNDTDITGIDRSDVPTHVSQGDASSLPDHTAFAFFNFDHNVTTGDDKVDGTAATAGEAVFSETSDDATDVISSTAYTAQKFATTAATALDTIAIYMERESGVTGHLTVGIFADDSGDPPAVDGANWDTNKVANSEFDLLQGWIGETATEWVGHTYTTSPTLVATDDYWVIVKTFDRIADEGNGSINNAAWDIWDEGNGSIDNSAWSTINQI